MTTADFKAQEGLVPGATFYTSEGMTIRVEDVYADKDPWLSVKLGPGKWGPIPMFKVLGHFKGMGECPSGYAISPEELARVNIIPYIVEPKPKN